MVAHFSIHSAAFSVVVAELVVFTMPMYSKFSASLQYPHSTSEVLRGILSTANSPTTIWRPEKLRFRQTKDGCIAAALSLASVLPWVVHAVLTLCLQVSPDESRVTASGSVPDMTAFRSDCDCGPTIPALGKGLLPLNQTEVGESKKKGPE